MTNTTVQNRNPFASYRVRQVASKTVVSFTPRDPANPRNWSRVCIIPYLRSLFLVIYYCPWLRNADVLYLQKRKFLILFTAVIGVLNSTLGSALPSGAVSYIAEDFHIESEEELVLPISLFLVGYVCGPIICGPLSESYGRKLVLVTAFVFFMGFTLGCAVTPTWAGLLVFRFLIGVVASAPISIVGGLLADIHGDPKQRGIAMAYAMTVSAQCHAVHLDPIDSNRPPTSGPLLDRPFPALSRWLAGGGRSG